MTNNNRIYGRDQLRFLTAGVNHIPARAGEIQKDFPGGGDGAKEDSDRGIYHLNKAFYHLNWTSAGETDPWD